MTRQIQPGLFTTKVLPGNAQTIDKLISRSELSGGKTKTGIWLHNQRYSLSPELLAGPRIDDDVWQEAGRRFFVGSFSACLFFAPVPANDSE